MKPSINLKTASLEQISAAVAEHVAGWTRVDPSWPWKDNKGTWCADCEIPKFATSFDAVFPLLEKFGSWDMNWHATTKIVWVWVYTAGKCERFDGHAGAAPLAACIALLRAHGVTVVDGGPNAEVVE